MAANLPGVHKALSSNLKQIKPQKQRMLRNITRGLFHLHVWRGGKGVSL